MSPRVPSPLAEPSFMTGLMATYRPTGGHDALVDANGQIRPVWQGFIAEAERMGADAFAQRFARADAHLASSGVVHRVYGDGDGVRPWPLSHMPVLVSAEDWAHLSAGVAERAAFLNAFLCDAYGDAAFVRDGLVPAALYAGSPEWARPMVQNGQGGGQPLRFYAADLACGADGQWRVLSDRTQAPSGAGYAVENRLALARALPDLYRSLQIERLAGFFQAFRAHLVSLKRYPDARLALMSPGPMNETYFEHSYLARYLGLVLVEGQDLVVRDGEVFIRTVAGLKPCDVLWRRVDSDFTDPLEFNMRSRLGVPGLADAVRRGGVTVVNDIGSGLAESRALMAVMPALAEKIRGHDLRLPTLNTQWGIDQTAAQWIDEHFDDLVIGSAFGAPLPGIGTGSAIGGSLSHDDRAALRQHLHRRGVDLVAQEQIKLATTPVLTSHGLVPRPFVLRVFAAWTGEGWHVMPGGLARVSDSDDLSAVSLQRGGRSADVWVLSEGPVAQTTLLRGAHTPRIRRSPGSLPSRAADNLFWLGRYVERTEFMTRLLRAALARADRNDAAIYEAICATLTSWGSLAAFKPGEPPLPAELARAVLHGWDRPQSILALSRNALSAASSIRDRFSPDAWRVLNDLMALVEKPLMDALPEGEADDRVRDVLRLLAAFSGLAQDNMNRLIGWRFLDLGKRIERGIAMARLIERFASDDPWACDLLLELGDSTLTYRLRYVDVPERAPVLDLLLLDPANPRSLAFQVARINDHLTSMPINAAEGRLGPAAALAMAIQATMTASDAIDLPRELPARLADDLMRLSEIIFTAHVQPDTGRSG